MRLSTSSRHVGCGHAILGDQMGDFKFGKNAHAPRAAASQEADLVILVTFERSALQAADFDRTVARMRDIGFAHIPPQTHAGAHGGGVRERGRIAPYRSFRMANGEKRYQWPDRGRRLDFEFRRDRSASPHIDMWAGFRDPKSAFKIIRGEDIVVIDKDDQGRPGVRDAALAGIGDAKPLFANVSRQGMPRQIPLVGQGLVRRIIDDEQFPLLRGNGLRPQGPEDALQIGLARIMGAKHDRRLDPSTGVLSHIGHPSLRRPVVRLHQRVMIFEPRTSTSILVRKKQSSASFGWQTTGSFSLNEVFRTIGIPVNSRNSLISW